MLFLKGLFSKAPDRLLGLTKFYRFSSFNEKLKDFNITIESSILLERGMGSSAAVAGHCKGSIRFSTASC